MTSMRLILRFIAMTEIFVTGMGLVTALGAGCEANVTALAQGRSGISHPCILDTALREIMVGEVKLTDTELALMTGADDTLSRLRNAMLGIVAAREAMAGMTPRRAALICGTTVGGMDNTERIFGEVIADGAAAAVTSQMALNDCEHTTRLIARDLGDFDIVTTTSTACSSAANAIIFGARLIQAGLVDMALVGGVEALTRFHVNGFNSLMILDNERCRPFDTSRAGINLGEGAGFMLIESRCSMEARGVRPIARLAGWGNACDAYHQTASSADGEGAYRAMTGAIADAGISPGDIGYVNAHGTGTPNNDASELAAMRRVWGDVMPLYSSTKAYTGHTTSASGSIEPILSLLALRRGFVPLSAGCVSPIDTAVAPVTEATSSRGVRYFLNNSFGFGGNDSTLIFDLDV